MLPRRLRKMPRNFKDFETRYAWSVTHAARLVGVNHRPRIKEEARKELVRVARGYIVSFLRHPNMMHIFPLGSTIFQYDFARGVRDGANLKTTIRTLSPYRHSTYTTFGDPSAYTDEESLKKQIEHLKPQKGMVVHDYSNTGETLLTIQEILGNKSKLFFDFDRYKWRNKDVGDKIPFAFHPLSEHQDKAWAIVPIRNREKRLVSTRFLSSNQHTFDKDTLYEKSKIATELLQRQNSYVLNKDYDKNSRSVKLTFAPRPENLSKNDLILLRRRIYAAGVAASRELLQRSPKLQLRIAAS